MLKLMIGLVTILGFAGSALAQTPPPTPKQDNQPVVTQTAPTSTPKAAKKAKKACKKGKRMKKHAATATAPAAAPAPAAK